MVIRVAGAILCSLMPLNWLHHTLSYWPGYGFRLSLLLGALIAISLSGVASAVVLGARTDRIAVATRAIALGLALFAAAGPFLLNAWIRSDYERYLWVIRQAYPCSSMGSGPGMLWVSVTSWLFALGALTFAVGDGALTRPGLSLGVVIGLVLAGLTALAMFPAPEVFAWLLGCL